MTVALAAASITTAHAATSSKKPAASKTAKTKGKAVGKHKAGAKIAAASSDEAATTKVRKVVTVKGKRRVIVVERGARPVRAAFVPAVPTLGEACLLYTSDAADE